MSGRAVVAVIERARERDLDLLLRMELESSSPAARALWTGAGLEAPVEPVEVTAQVPRSDTRPTDLVAKHAGSAHRMLIESKAADGQFEDGQAESYRVEVAATGDVALLVAPQTFIESMSSSERCCFDQHIISVETLADELRSAASSDAETDPELIRSWRFRAGCYEWLAVRARPGHPDDDVSAFGDRYRAIAQEVTSGRVRINAAVLRNASTGFVQFQADYPAPRPLYLQHKLQFGYLDLRVPGYTKEELGAELDDLADDEKPPPGWRVERPRQARTDRKTGDVRPVLRFDLGQPLSKPYSFDESEAVLRRALAVADELGHWLTRRGYALLVPRPSEALLTGSLRRARAIAGDLELYDVVAAVEKAQELISAPPFG